MVDLMGEGVETVTDWPTPGTPLQCGDVVDIRACLFDVFGTVVDWRTSVSRDLTTFAGERGIHGVDWLEFAVEWRKLYQPGLEEVRSGRRPFILLDVLHARASRSSSGASDSRDFPPPTSIT